MIDLLGRFIVQVGFPIVVALILLGVMVGVLPSPLTEINGLMRAHRDSTESAAMASLVNDQTRLRELEVQTLLLQVVCRNVARSESERINCDLYRIPERRRNP